MARHDDDRSDLDGIAEEFAVRLRQGERPSISEYEQRHPKLATEIGELFPTIVAMEQLRGREQSLRKTAQFVAVGRPGGLDQLGDYRIIREIGRGGMGVVYEAEQQSLRRRVAVKVLTPGSVNSAKQLERFRREAKAAARLHHTNIVPVFGIGEQDGLNYYVMQLIEGAGLDQVVQSLRETSADPRTRDRVEEADSRSSSLSTAAVSAAAALRDGTFPSSRTLESGAASSSASLSSPTGRMATDGEACDHALTTGQHDGTATADGNRAARPDGPLGEPFFIRGPGQLAHRYWRGVARVGLQLAEALQYAHHHGVLHRDIKPSNLLLDRDGIVWIADFGLAKFEDYEAATRSGDLVGTLRYMAPEQFSGRADHRSDTYGLGLTLYELLTLRRAFEETKHSTLIHQKTTSVPLAPRAINSRIPRDLEAIVLKACATDPDARYATAGDLAVDLRKFLDDRPIFARPSRIWERLWRWSRRNPTTAALSGLSLLLMMMVALAAAGGHYQTRLALTRAEGERAKAVQAADDAQREHVRADTNVHTAVEAFGKIIDNIEARGVPRSLEMDLDERESGATETAVTAADGELLQTLLTFFNEFARRNSDALRAETAAAHARVGDIQQRLGNLQQAESAYRNADRSYAELSVRYPENGDDMLGRARALNSLAVTLSKRGDMRGAFENHRQAVFWLEQNISRVPSNDAKFELARTLNLQGSISDRMGTAGLPPTPPMDRPSKKNPLPVRPPRFGPPPMFFGFAQSNERALGLLNELVATEPKNVEYRLELAQCHSNSARRARLSGDLSGTSQSMETAVGLLEQLARDHPHDPRLQYELADTLLFSASLASSSTNDENVQGRIQSALAICERLGVAYPNVPDYKALLANALGKTAAALLAAGESDGAQRSYERAVEYEQRLVADFPAMTRYRVAYSRTLLELAELHRRGGRFDAAQQHLMRAVRDLESAGSAFAYRQVLGRLYRSLAETLAQKGETARAEEFREKARAATSLPRDFGRKKGRE